ncbi:hypothetical protein A2572_01120 [Candidatus Collierbacteria bacterium RIFOXYD1_FULL_40_9]|uniref:Uncharacterized protein n=1 Tax=Candidatus Collierbacteria bacterium RIFOXYD1_FULL_40_9 TaxID=1817731 RepID=A0A1F5FP16_9BACT|nr:MAG: hypothetical protein A2572_01120 [Candidatus Collierbacteria bacterium RIFOXYD1_FULL_40_9]
MNKERLLVAISLTLGSLLFSGLEVLLFKTTGIINLSQVTFPSVSIYASIMVLFSINLLSLVLYALINRLLNQNRPFLYITVFVFYSTLPLTLWFQIIKLLNIQPGISLMLQLVLSLITYIIHLLLWVFIIDTTGFLKPKTTN